MVVRDIRTARGDRVIRNILKLNGMSIAVGILREDFVKPKTTIGTSPSFVTLGEVAVSQEFGTAFIPARSFIRTAFDENYMKWAAYQKLLLVEILKGRLTAEQLGEKLGKRLVDDIKLKIKSITRPELAPVTIEIRRALGITSVKPLELTLQLYNSIRHEVRWYGAA